MGTYSDPALILTNSVGQDELKADSKKNVAGGVCALGSSKEPIIYTDDDSSQLKIVDALVATKGASINAFVDPAYIGTDYASNCYFDGTNWIKFDATKPAHSLYHDTANDQTSLWRSAVSEAQGQPIANWVKHTILEADIANGLASLDGSGLIKEAQLPTRSARVNSDSYVGNNTANRAIPHGLGRTPKMVQLTINLGQDLRIVKPGSIEYLSASADEKYSVITWDDTNFYVGNASDYTKSGNSSGYTYNWVVIG